MNEITAEQLAMLFVTHVFSKHGGEGFESLPHRLHQLGVRTSAPGSPSHLLLLFFTCIHTLDTGGCAACACGLFGPRRPVFEAFLASACTSIEERLVKYDYGGMDLPFTGGIKPLLLLVLMLDPWF